VQLRSAAAEVSGEERRREIDKRVLLFSCSALEILFYALVQNIYTIREHQNPIHSLSVLTPTVAS
jgi:hypothetical protein